MMRALSSVALLALLSGGAPEDRSSVVPNDNRIPAGRLAGDTLRLRLVVDVAAWRPEADSGPEIEVPVFAEEGKAPQVPGPLIRVREGTVISATVKNALADSTLRIYGLATRPAAVHDSLVIPPGQSRTVTFPAGVPGSYLYWASLGNTTHERDEENEQLAGAFIVDPAAGSPPDRVLVVNIWGTRTPERYRAAVAINGRSWPYTERIAATVGDTLRWRVINATWRGHPMHLHGFYYRVDAKGDTFADTLYAPAERRLAVTEILRPLQTMAMTWVPERAGNWLFHCHLAFHVVPGIRLNPPGADSHDRMAHDAAAHMAGLVVGIAVRPRPGDRDEVRGKARRLHLFVQEGARRGHSPRAMGFVLQRDDRPPAADSVEIPGSVLVLTRGQPTDVVIVNRLKEPSAIHWHGIELESYSDGVAGWSGAEGRLAPSVMPGDSFTARLTLPRAGTFIYHTHLNDIEQLTSGLYGAIVVLEPGQRFDPRRDHVFVTGWDGETRLPAMPHLLINGDSTPAPLVLTAGVSHRLRFVNIGPAGLNRYSLLRDSSLVRWKRLAKDGADLPPHQAVETRSAVVMGVGETYDFEFRPEPGSYRLVAEFRDKVLWSRELVAR
ncbi:MAG TPA: multicopper oxidase domain-containing protein [Gemmatimonadales bacterium]